MPTNPRPDPLAEMRQLAKAADFPGPMAVYDYDSEPSAKALKHEDQNQLVFLVEDRKMFPKGQWAGGGRNRAGSEFMAAAVNYVTKLLAGADDAD